MSGVERGVVKRGVGAKTRDVGVERRGVEAEEGAEGRGLAEEEEEGRRANEGKIWDQIQCNSAQRPLELAFSRLLWHRLRVVIMILFQHHFYPVAQLCVCVCVWVCMCV